MRTDMGAGERARRDKAQELSLLSELRQERRRSPWKLVEDICGVKLYFWQRLALRALKARTGRPPQR